MHAQSQAQVRRLLFQPVRRRRRQRRLDPIEKLQLAAHTREPAELGDRPFQGGMLGGQHAQADHQRVRLRPRIGVIFERTDFVLERRVRQQAVVVKAKRAEVEIGALRPQRLQDRGREGELARTVALHMTRADKDHTSAVAAEQAGEEVVGGVGAGDVDISADEARLAAAQMRHQRRHAFKQMFCFVTRRLVVTHGLVRRFAGRRRVPSRLR